MSKRCYRYYGGLLVSQEKSQWRSKTQIKQAIIKADLKPPVDGRSFGEKLPIYEIAAVSRGKS